MVNMPTGVDLPRRTVRRYLDSDADQRLLEFAYERGIYPRGSQAHVEDGFADAIHTLLDIAEETQHADGDDEQGAFTLKEDGDDDDPSLGLTSDDISTGGTPVED